MSTFKIYPLRLGHSEQDYAFSFARAKFGQKIVWFMHGCFALVNNETGELTMMDTGSRHWTEVEKYNLPWTTNVEKGPTLGSIETSDFTVSLGVVRRMLGLLSPVRTGTPPLLVGIRSKIS